MRRLFTLTLTVLLLTALFGAFDERRGQGSAQAAAADNLKVLVVAGLTSNSAGAVDLRRHMVEALSGLIEKSNITWVSYANVVPETWEEPYTKEDTCKGVDKAKDNIDRALATYPDATFILIGHSLGGFAIAKWASEKASLNQISKIITLDSPWKSAAWLAFSWTLFSYAHSSEETVRSIGIS
jgi:alpha-beta hydrolase superfamily lysophospholipase